MRICFTSDLHGDAGLYQQLEDLLRAETLDLLILGGDLLPDGERDDPLGTQVAYLERVLMPRIVVWKAAGPHLDIACIAGNHESACAWDALQAHHDAGRIILLNHRRLWQRDRVSFLGYSSTPATPHWGKDFERLDLPGDPIPSFAGVAWDADRRCVSPVDLARHFGGRATIAEELALAPIAPDPWIFVAHTPPYESALDRLSNVPAPIGSRAVRRFIEERRPLVALHGHSHESPRLTGRYTEQVGTTLCINPGQGDTRLHAVLFESERPAETLQHTVFGVP
jgi:uncharacterized protein